MMDHLMAKFSVQRSEVPLSLIRSHQSDVTAVGKV